MSRTPDPNKKHSSRAATSRRREKARSEKHLRRAELRRRFHAGDRPSARRIAAECTVLSGILVIILIACAAILTAASLKDQSIHISEYLLYAMIGAVVLHFLLALVLYLIARHVDFSRFKKRAEAAETDSSVIRLFKEEIDLPYVVTDEDGKIIVANRAFEDAASEAKRTVGTDIRDICSTALDEIIRATTADRAADQEIAEVYDAAVRAYPTVLHELTTADACLGFLRKIEKLIPPRSEDTADALTTVHDIVSEALGEAEKRSALWSLCLSTFENILTGDEPSADQREKLDHIHDLACTAYKEALKTEKEHLERSNLRDFRDTLYSVVLTAEGDPASEQEARAYRMRLEMFEGKNLLFHVKNLLLNIRRAAEKALPSSPAFTENRDTVALGNILKFTEDALTEIRKKSPAVQDERAFCTSTLSAILSASESIGTGSAARALFTVRGIASVALSALRPEQYDSYISHVVHEILTASEHDRETNPTSAEIYRIVKSFHQTLKQNSTSKDFFTEAFLDAVKRITEHSRLTSDDAYTEADRIQEIIEREVSGALALLELRTVGVSTLSSLQKQCEDILSARDLSVSDRALAEYALKKLKEQLENVRSVRSLSPEEVHPMIQGVSSAFSAILRRFDERGDYAPTDTAISESDRSARASMVLFYAAVEKVAGNPPQITARQIESSFFSAISRLDLPESAAHLLLWNEASSTPVPPVSEKTSCLSEVSMDASDSHVLSRLLLHIGVLRHLARTENAPVWDEYAGYAEETLDKLLTRLILTEALVKYPIVFLLRSRDEGASDASLYETAAAFYRAAPSHRERLHLSAFRHLTADALHLLRLAGTASPADAYEEPEREALETVARIASDAHERLTEYQIENDRDAFRKAARAVFVSCEEAISPLAERSGEAAVYTAILRHVLHLFDDMNAHLLRRECYNTYRSTAAEIVSRLFRAEYTLTAMDEIRSLTEELLNSAEHLSLSFSGHTLKDSCSEDLRTIAGLSGTDILSRLGEFADVSAEAALGSKNLWEYRKLTLTRLRRRLEYSDVCYRFYTEVLARRSNFTGLRRLIREIRTYLKSAKEAEKNAKKHAASPTEATEKAVQKYAEELSSLRVSIRDNALALLGRLNDVGEDLVRSDDPIGSVPVHFRTALAAAAEEIPSDKKFVEVISTLHTEFDRIYKEAFAYRQSKKEILFLNSALRNEEALALTPDHGTTLSRSHLYDLFSEFLNAATHVIQPHRHKNRIVSDIHHILAAATAGIENDTSLYFRVFLSASLFRLSRHAEEYFHASECAPIMRALSGLLSEIAKNAENRDRFPSRESLLTLASHAFRVVDTLYFMGEVADDLRKIQRRLTPKDRGDESSTPNPNDSAKILNAVTEVRQKIETCRTALRDHGAASAEQFRFPPLDTLFEALDTCFHAYLHAESGKDSLRDCEQLSFLLTEACELTAPYLPLPTMRESAAFREETARTRRNLREIAEATESSGSRAVTSSALAAIAQYARTHGDAEEIPAVSENAIAAIAAIPGGTQTANKVYDVAITALSEIISITSLPQTRVYASTALLDLSERKTLYAFLVSHPLKHLTDQFIDPTDASIYKNAQEMYRHLSAVAPRYHGAFFENVMSGALESLRSITAPGAFSRLHLACDLIEKETDSLESTIRSLPIDGSDRFIPPSVREKARMLRTHLERLFNFGKKATGECAGDEKKRALADRITLIAYRGILEFENIVADPNEEAIEQIPAFCRKITRETRAILRETELSDRHLADIRHRTEVLLDSLSLPGLFDESVRDEEYAASARNLRTSISQSLERLTERVEKFRQESGGTEIPGRAAILRCERVIQNAARLLHDFDERKETLAFDVLAAAVSDQIARYAEQKGSPQTPRLVAVYDKRGRPSGKNNTGTSVSEKKSDTFVPVEPGNEASYRLHGLSIAKASYHEGQAVRLGEKRYVARSYPHHTGGKEYYLVTFREVEDTLLLKRAYEDNNTVVALITLDNLEELTQYVRVDYREAEKNVEKALRDWAGSIHGIFHEYERDKYVLFFSQKELESLVNNRFSDILTTLEGIKLGDSNLSVTISMGIAAIGDTLTVKERNAGQALDVALKRGGAQIVVFRDAESAEEKYEFFRGSQIKGIQNENLVGTRVVANYLCELIEKSTDVLVMGHAYPDFDSIGSCVGIAALARYFKKEVHIVVNRQTQNFIDCTPDLRNLPEYRNTFINGTTGMELKGTNTLLVLCDVSNLNIMESSDLARNSFNTVIIDHHIMTTDSEDLKTLLTYIDPSASSASELVSEILSEVLPKGELYKEEANVLLSGIMVDTKNFTRSVGARTFSAALYLRQMGASAEISNTFFFEENGDYKAEVIFRRNLSFQKNHKEIAFTFCSEDDIREDPDVSSCNLRVAASKAADKLLTVRGIHAAFALYPYRNGSRSGISISGRSDGTINVQLILEEFRGGGHFDSAGASLENKTIEEVLTALSDAVDRYFEEDEK